MRIARSVWIVVAVALAAGGAVLWKETRPRHNVILFVADGLRSGMVTPETAPALAALRAEGVDFPNSHAVYPTVTTANASAMATGHYLGDTGNFGNYLYVGQPALPPPSEAGVVPSIEDNVDLAEVEERFGGDYLNEETFLEAARQAGYATAAIGKRGPVAVHGVHDRSNLEAIVIDDSTGRPAPAGIPLAADVVAAIAAAGLPVQAPGRGPNGEAGTFERAGTHTANAAQQDWFVKVATQVLLPRFRKSGKPFAMVFWSRDPDGTQHYQGDSLNQLTPGINGPTTLAAIRNASDDLQRLRDALKAQGLDKTTDIVVTADHGFSTISKQSQTSPSVLLSFPDTVKGFLPTGFLAADLSLHFGLPVWTASGQPVALKDGVHPPKSGALIGLDQAHPDMVVAVNGGSDLIYLTGKDPKAQAREVAAFLAAQDYTGAIFVDDALGPVPGTLPMSAVNLSGSAKTPRPSMVVAFRSYSSGCARPDTCVVLVSDSELQQGQGSHGSLSRGDTHNFMAAVGPDFRKGFVDPTPVSNADLAPTIAKALGFQLKAKGRLKGRVIDEALKDGKATPYEVKILRSDMGPNGFHTVLNYQEAAGVRYLDAAGMPGRVFGVQP